jgi:hypothetical protein
MVMIAVITTMNTKYLDLFMSTSLFFVADEKVNFLCLLRAIHGAGVTVGFAERTTKGGTSGCVSLYRR